MHVSTERLLPRKLFLEAGSGWKIGQDDKWMNW